MALPIYGLGREEKAYVVQEATFGVAASVPAVTNAVKFLNLSIDQKEDRVEREDKRASRSFLARVQRRKNVTWSIDGYLLPSGAAGTAPDGWDDLLTNVFGLQTIVGSTSVTYTLVKEYQHSLTLHRAVGHTLANAVFAEMARGCVADKLSIKLSGADEAKITISGFGVDVLRCGASLSTSTGSITSLVVTAGDGPKFDAGVYINVDVDADLLVSAVSTDTLTIPTTTVAVADKIVPSACVKGQTFVSTAVPISGILGSCTLAGSTIEVVSAEVNLENNTKIHNDKYGAAVATGYHAANRKVSGSIQVRLTADNFLTIAKAKGLSTGAVPANVALILVAGTAAGSIATLNMPTVQLDYSAIPSVAAEEIMVTLPFIALGNSGEDELTLALT